MKKKSEPKAPREHTQVGDYRPRTTVGRKWVKKANLWVNYTCYNKPNQSDQQEWV